MYGNQFVEDSDKNNESAKNERLVNFLGTSNFSGLLIPQAS